MSFFEKLKKMPGKNMIARVLDHFNYGKKNKALPEGRQDNIVRRGGLTPEEIYRIERYKAKRSQRYNQTPIQLQQRRNTAINYSNSRRIIEERRKISAPKSKKAEKENIANVLREKPNYIQKKPNSVQEKTHYIQSYDKYQKSIKNLKNEAKTMKISVNPERTEELNKKIQDLNRKVEDSNNRYNKKFKDMQEAYNKTKRGKKIIDYTKAIQNRSADKRDGKVEKIVTKRDERVNMQESLKRGVSLSIEKSSYDKAVDEFERALRRRNRLDRMNRRDDDGRGIG